LSRFTASTELAKCNPADDCLLGLLRSDDVRNKKLGCAIVERMVSPNASHHIPGSQVVESIRELLDDNAFSMMPSRHDNLLAWINAT